MQRLDSLLGSPLTSYQQLIYPSLMMIHYSPDRLQAITGWQYMSILSCTSDGMQENNAESLSRTLKSLTQLEQLNIEVDYESPALWEALYGLHIKRLGLCITRKDIPEDHVDSLSKTLKSLKDLDEIIIITDEGRPALWDALNGLNIKSLLLDGKENGLNKNHGKSLSESLTSLTQLKYLGILMFHYNSRYLWDALYGMNIVSLSLMCVWDDFRLIGEKSLSETLKSLSHLEDLIIEENDVSSGLLKALNGINIKLLSLKGVDKGFSVNHVQSMSETLTSLTHLYKICIALSNEGPCLWESLYGLNIKSLILRSERTVLTVKKVESFSASLKSLNQLDKITIEMNTDSPGLWEALCGIHIKRLYLTGCSGGLEVNHAESMSQSLASFTQLESLWIEVSIRL
ncbi:hypothetical protein DPMN_097049 [Dreissena polymorpha]|uniref:Uncharacterized protein n=1 Tax=Dreissena polymorpha TaxID=45954 RepID=A0A9D4R479_DREPO|nr:hypothetical protein DPMN_097049 [Dreissena polymorpha]